jgi:hypothetical protein
LIHKLETSIDLVSYDTSFNLDLRHNNWEQQLMDAEEAIVWHEPILDFHWNRIEEKINQLKQPHNVTDIHDIYIENLEMKKERIVALVDILVSGRATNSSAYVKFNHANLCGEGIISLSKLVDVCPHLYELQLNDNLIDNMDSARCLSRSLKLHDRINTISLAHCDLGSSPEILSVILQSDVKHINLENNNIDSLGAVTIAEYLEGDPPMKELFLQYNRVNDDDIILISQALKRNKNLAIINLHSNNLTSLGVKTLLTCFFDSSSLNAISGSNHTLQQLFFYEWQDPTSLHRLQDCISRLLELGRAEKIISALQDKESLLKYLANVPVELTPEVLEFTRLVDDQSHKHLNIVYSTMRWWNMPFLYSYRNSVKPDTKRKRDME